MRIAFDAKWYHRGPAGVRTHTRNLLDTLREIDAENEYDVFLRGADAIPAHLEGPRWRLRRLRPDLSAPRVWWALPRAVRDQPVDLFFTQSLVPSTRRAPRVVTVHDVLWHDFPEHFTWRERLHFRLIDRDIRRAEIIITDSVHSRERICATSGRSADDVVVVPLGVNARFLAPPDETACESLRRRLDLPERFLLYVGRINRRKNLPTLFEAVAKLPEPVPLVCAGAADWRQDDLDATLRRLGLGNRVSFLGHVDDADLPALFALATVFTYIPFAEGFGIPPLEAMACGTPVVASNSTSIPEVVGDAGLLVSPHDADAVADALAHLLRDESARQSLGERGRIRATGFTWRRTAEKVLEVWGRFT